ncbi:MAG: nickel-binding protein [Tepidiformaceae bacterium]
MPLFMDVHNVIGEKPTLEDVEQAHQRDLEIGPKFQVNWLKYWVNFERGTASCLCEAPSAEAAANCHRESHGLVADKMIAVAPEMVEAFLGGVGINFDGRAVLVDGEHKVSDGGSRAIMFTDMFESTGTTQRLGDDGAMVQLRLHNNIIRTCLSDHVGREVKHTGDGIMASFFSPSRAMECGIAIQRELVKHNEREPEAPIRVRIGFSAGEPVADGDDLFGAAVQLAARVCNSAEPEQILVSAVVRDLCIGKRFAFSDRGERQLKGFDAPVHVFALDWR